MRELRYAHFWLVAGLILVMLFLAALLMPATRAPVAVSDFDKLAHVAGFMLLTLWFCGVYRRRAYPWVAIAMLLFGVLTEYLQYAFTRSRSGDLMDVVADGVGIALAMVLAMTGLDRWCEVAEQLGARQ